MAEHNSEFALWQAKLNILISSFPGFVSLEILSMDGWSLVQRFHDEDTLLRWKNSPERQELMNQLQRFDVKEIEELTTGVSNVTEVFVTEVAADKVEAYRSWMAKIHQVEAKFPGFKGVYVQSPTTAQGRNWITLLQFDSPENLDRWLVSEERLEVLKEAEPLIASLESHRVASPYGGWFGSIAKEQGALPPVWKQTFVVLLVLFPIVMLELKFLSPYTASLPLAMGTFIANAISVGLIAWPSMPIAIYFLSWWLSPKAALKTTLLGCLLLFFLYLLEIVIFLIYS